MIIAKLLQIMVESVSRYAAFFINGLMYLKDLLIFSKKRNPNFELSFLNLYPCLNDRTTFTPIEPIYFYQNNWCAEKIAENKPTHHIDVGSSAIFVSLLSKFVKTTMVDIRPIPLTTTQLQFVKGDITRLPYKDKSVSSLSSICVIEHIGLGRYGDTLDPYGSEKAATELKRILAKGGNLYISVPVYPDNRIYFNAHRAFHPSYIKSMFEELKLIEQRYIYNTKIYQRFVPEYGFGTGLFYFKRQ